MELFKLLGTIAIDNSGANKALDDTSSQGQKTESKLSKAFKGIGRGAVAVGKAVGTGMIAAGTAVTGLVMTATNAYAEFEQLKGGVETLFKDSASTVMGYANAAFETAGMSANEYMETVTSFSASLLQSLGGDTAKAADWADMAIRDMADNANKMGTNISNIQNAYQGFAKQNYTMLDNLKLGYGGTQQEMYRLMCDAKEIDETFDAVFSLDSKGHLTAGYADIVEAIHIVQQEMGITGTTAQEAAGTISGSTASVKAAWENLLVAMADDNANVGEYVGIFVNSAATALKNYMPRIGVALEGVVQLVEELAPVLIAEIPGLIGQLLPSIITAATGLLNALVGMLPQMLSTLTTQVLPQLLMAFSSIFYTLITSSAEFIQTNLPILTDKAKGMMEGFGEKIRENLPVVISKGLDILMGLSEMLLQNLPTLIAAGMDMLKSIVQGIIDAFPDLIAKGPEIISNLANTISNSMQTIFFKGAEIIWELIKGIIGAIPDLVANFPAVIQAIFDVWNAINWLNLGKNLINGIKTGLKNAWSGLKSTASSLFGNLKDTIMHPINSAKTLIKGVIDAIKGFFSFKISWPKIPMPHFKVKPDGWKIGDLLKGKIPSLGIDWYAKAMDNPVIMTKPTVFGYNGATGELMAGGEKGRSGGGEVVSGVNTLMTMIREAVATQNEALASRLDTLLAMLAEYFPEALEAMRTPATFDPDHAARAMAVPMNRELGRLATQTGRGR